MFGFSGRENMYKIIIVDDEKRIREGLKTMIPWETLGFEVVGIFGDGVDALEFLNMVPIDVVLTDIMMNRMSGIELARFIREEQMPCKVIFISAYKKFDLALQAIKYGVEDYILKPTKPSEVREVLNKIKQELDRRKEDLEQREVETSRWKEVFPTLEEKLIGNLIMGALDDKELLKQQWRLLYPQVDLEQCPCVLADLKIKDYQAFLKERWNYGLGEFEDALYSFFRVYEGAGHFFIVYKNKGYLKVFGIIKQFSLSSEENKVFSSQQLRNFVDQMTEIFSFDVLIETEKIFDNLYQIADEKEAIIGADMFGNNAQIYFYEKKKMVFTNLMTGNINMAHKIVRDMIEYISEEDIRYRRHMLADIFSGISEFLWENNRQLFAVVQPFILSRNIANMSSRQEIEVYCNCVFESMKTKEAMSNYFEQDKLVNQIKKYVQEHIYEDVSLEFVADEMFVSSAYLSRLFKKSTGENFLQFVTRMKIEEAVKLLSDPQYKVYQVGEKLGYKTTRHFSRLFNSFMGAYPSQYRKSVLGIGDGTDEE